MEALEENGDHGRNEVEMMVDHSLVDVGNKGSRREGEFRDELQGETHQVMVVYEMPVVNLEACARRENIAVLAAESIDVVSATSGALCCGHASLHWAGKIPLAGDRLETHVGRIVEYIGPPLAFSLFQLQGFPFYLRRKLVVLREEKLVLIGLCFAARGELNENCLSTQRFEQKRK